MSSGVIDTMSIPAFSAASASSIVLTRSMVSCRLPFIALRSAIVGLFRLMTILSAEVTGSLCGGRDRHVVELVAVRPRRRRQFTLQVMILVAELPEQHRPDFPVSVPHRRVRRRQVVLD